MGILGSENEFAKLLLTNSGSAATPDAGLGKLYVNGSKVLHYVDDTGADIAITAFTGLTDPMTTRGDIIVRNASNVTARLAIGSTGKVLSSDGTDISWQTPAGGGSGALLGVCAYDPGTETSGVYSNATNTIADADATNMKVTFTAPASGNVIVVQECGMEHTGSSGVSKWSIRDGSTTKGEGMVNGTTTVLSFYRATVTHYVTGLTPTTSYTYKWGFRTTVGTTYLTFGATYGKAIMLVHAAP